MLASMYLFEAIGKVGSLNRLDCVASTKDYTPFERMRGKRGGNRWRLYVYYAPTPHTKAVKRGRSPMSITHGKHISALFFLNPQIPIAYGDYNGDAIIFDCRLLSVDRNHARIGSRIACYIINGQAGNAGRICNDIIRGRLSFANLDMRQIKQEPIDNHIQGVLFSPSDFDTFSNHYDYE